MASPRIYITDKNKEGLIHNDFCYREVKKRAADGGIFWRCIHKGCKGRMKTDEDKEQVFYDGGHDHQADIAEMTVREVKTRARKRARTETTPIPAIYWQEIGALSAMPAAAAKMPAFGSVSHTLYRERRSVLPALPASRQALVIPQQFQNTSAGQRFILKIGRNNRYIIFASDENLRELCNAQLISMDGTFSTVPAIYQQLFTIHAFFDSRLLPLVYVLMAKKSTNAYMKVFSALKTACLNLGCQLQPTEIMTDFESGLISSIQQEFPGAMHKGCHFHLCQAIWRQVQNLGLATLYFTDTNVEQQVRDLMALAFARLPLIQTTFLSLQTASDPRLAPLFTYFQNQWMRPGLTTMWNMYDADVRTNNNHEGWHNRFTNATGKHHPNIWEFIIVVQKEQACTEVQIQQMAAGINVGRNNAKYIRVTHNIRSLRRRYANGQLNTLQFIRGISHNLKHYN